MISIFDRAKFKKIGVLADFLQEVDGFLRKVQDTIEGTFLVGENITLADVMIYPWFQRWVIIEHFFDFPLPVKYVKIQKWIATMNQRKSIIETKKLTNNEYYIERTKKMMSKL